MEQTISGTKSSCKCVEWAVADGRHGAIGGGQKRLCGENNTILRNVR